MVAAPLRLLFVADPAAAGRAVEPVRGRVAVEAALAPTAVVLEAALRDAAWDAVLFVPGGPVAEADVASALAGRPVPLVVVSAGGVPRALASVAARTLDPAGLGALPDVLAQVAAADPAAFVGVANAALAESARTTAALADALVRASGRPCAPAPPAGRVTASPAPSLALEAESLAEHLPIGVYRSSPEGRILYANPALAAVLGCESVAALSALDVRRDLGYPRDAFAEEVRRAGAVRNLTVRWTDSRGRTVYTRENAQAVLDAAGAVRYYEGTMEDVTVEVEAREAERLRARHHEAAVRFAEAADGAETPDVLHAAAVTALHDATRADWVLLVRHEAASAGAPAGRNVVAAWAGRIPASGAAALSADPVFARMPVVTEPVLLRDVESGGPDRLPPSIAGLMRAHGMRAMGYFPLQRAGAPLGALVVGYDTPHTFCSGERQAAESLAWHLAGHLARHHAEQDLRDSEASLRFIAAHSGQVLYRLRYTPGTGEGAGGSVFDYLSPAVEALTGFAPADLEAAGGFRSLIEEREVFAGAGLARGPVGGATHYHALYRLHTRDAAECWVENHAYPWSDEAGQPVGLVGAFQDVTARKRLETDAADVAQQALARQSALVELSRIDDAAALVARVPELAWEAAAVDAASVWLVDGPWMVCRAVHSPPRPGGPPGRAAAAPSYPVEAFEAALGELHGQRALAVDVAGDDARVDLAGFRTFADDFDVAGFAAAPVRRAGQAVGMVVLHRTAPAGAWTEAETDFAGALADAVALAVERDERADAERALRRSEARYRVLSDLTSDYAFAVHARPDGGMAIAWATEAFTRISGYTPDEIATYHDFRALIHPDSLATVQDGLAALRERHEAEFEARIVARDGTTRWVCHRARLGESAPDGSALVYHCGQDVSERKRFEAALVAARELAEQSQAAAEETARLKSVFLADMSHEIRTPLAGILGYAEILSDDVGEAQREYVDLIARSGMRLLDTLNSVLDLARQEAEGAAPARPRIDAAADVREAALMLAPLATARGLALDVDAPGPAWALLDPACLGRIVTNLVGNALKFTPEGSVRVTVDTPAGRVRVRVADTGVGIDEAFLPHLFDEFRQEGTGAARPHDGSGLGLSITRRLTELMGGQIEVESRRPGGLTFTVSFPAAPDADVSAETVSTVNAAVSTVAPPALGGDGRALDADLRLVVCPAPPSAGRPAPLRPPPPAFSFSLRPPAGSAPAPAPTAMFDFRFGRTATSAPDPASPSEEVEWTAPPTAGAAVFPDGTSEVDASAPLPSPYAPPSGWAPEAPAAAPVAAPAPTRTAEPVMLVRPAREEPPAALAGDAREAGETRLPVLVVEDNFDTRMLIERILRGSYAVTAVGDARAALLAMNQQRFRGLVLDINLGGKETGADVLRIARALDGYGGVYAVALTAYALPGDRERLLGAGFNEYISKPFTRQSLMDALEAGIQA